MPRDNKGNVFGHGSEMMDKDGRKLKVVGFATVASGSIDMNRLPSVFGSQYRYYNWRDLHNVNTKEAPDFNTDACEVDRAQVKHGTAAVANAASDSGDKVIWGT